MTVLVLTPDERDEISAELEKARADRARMLERRAAHPELDHWKLPWQLDAIDRHTARMEALLADAAIEEPAA